MSTTQLPRKRSIGSWMRRLTGSGLRRVGPTSGKKSGVFGVSLCESICYARSTVGYVDEEAVKHRRAGIIPLVVAKCGSFLKANALHTQGIFRIPGSVKRIQHLQTIFDDPRESYGLNIHWLGYSVHDASSILRRYLQSLPEPVIPHEFYEPFRDVMSDKYYKSTEARIQAFQHLIQQLPIPHQHLLLYLLDMLSLFASNEMENRMDAANLAIVFAPSIFSHPSHNSPVQMAIMKRVLEFLIEFQALFTMQLLSRSSGLFKSSSVPDMAAAAATQKGGENTQQPPPVPPLPQQFATLPRSNNQQQQDPGLISPQPKRFIPPFPDQSHSSATSLPTPTSPNDKSRVDSLTSPVPDPITPADDAHTTPLTVTTSMDHDAAAEEDITPTPTRTHSPVVMMEEKVDPAKPFHIRLLHDTIMPLLQRQRSWLGKPIGYYAWIAMLSTIVGVVAYEGYQALWGMCCLEPYVFFVTFAIYWNLLLRGFSWTDQDPKKALPYDSYRGPWMGLFGKHYIDEGVDVDSDDDHHHQEDDAEGLSLFDDISEQGKDEEEAMLRDVACEWHSLFSRSWRMDDQGHPINKDADLLSVASTSSRFNEEIRGDNSDDDGQALDDDYDDDYDMVDIDSADLQALWQRQDQIRQDAELAARLQQEEQDKASHTNPFVEKKPPVTEGGPPPPPPPPAISTSEEWKIGQSRQQQPTKEG